MPYFPMVIENIEMSIALIFWNGKHVVMILDRDGNNGGDEEDDDDFFDYCHLV